LSNIYNILDAFASEFKVDVIFIDFDKAFDEVSHHILSNQLYSIAGICDPFLSWLTSYLTDRKQIVKLKLFQSEPFNIPSGVPQGSHLAPLLFLLFINDLYFSNSKKLLFADDMKIFRLIKLHSDTDLLQNDLIPLSEWSNLNKLPLNIDKCKVMFFTRSRSPI